MTAHVGAVDSGSEIHLLAHALEVRPEAVVRHSREPLGAGSVSGFVVDDGEPLTYFLDTSGLRLPVDEAADAGPRIWLHPADPHLPALAPVAFGDAAHTLLGRLGIMATGPGEFVGYRPGRRAVLRVPIEQSDVWLKVVRPSRVEIIVQAHAAAAASGLPLPEIHGWSSEGLIVMAAAEGIPVADTPWEPHVLLDEVERLRGRLSSVRWDRPIRSVVDRLDWYADRSAATRLIPRVRALIAAAGPAGRTPTVVHGDLHYGQLFMADGRITGLIDIDTLGVGDPAEDEAAFLSHTIASALLTTGSNEDRVWELADQAASRWANDEMTRALTVVHLIGHALAATDRHDTVAASSLERVSIAILDGLPPSDGRTEPSSKGSLTNGFDSP